VWWRIAVALLCLSAATARAQLTIEIVGGGSDQIPITVLPLAAEDKFQQRISEIVSADLARSGRFRVQDIGSVRPLPSEPSEVNYRYWKNRNSQSLVIGKVTPRSTARSRCAFACSTPPRKRRWSDMPTPLRCRNCARSHTRSPTSSYEKLTGEPGVFSTRIAYVARFPQRFELHVADADGFNSQFILAHKEPIISPAWSPDGTRIAYVSFEQRRSIVFIHNLIDGHAACAGAYDGINSAPSWSPDGKRVALALSKDGVSQVYLINPDGTGLTRVTNSNSIDTSPASP
jgi:TolB protein